MRKALWACALVILLILSLGISAPSAASSLTTIYHLPQVSSAPARADLEADVMALVNRDRVRFGLAPLAFSAPLRVAARGHGVEMFVHGYMSHTARNGSTPMDRALAAGVRAHLFGENLAYAADVSIAHRLLMNSPGHRANILSRAFHRLGIGVIDGGDKGVIVVENFAD
ncbi:MAG TPA: CAP domain-containing protein [bacterium]|jgi:uncharacterized protein YkwD